MPAPGTCDTAPVFSANQHLMQTDRGIFLALAELAGRYRLSGDPAEAGPLTAFELCCFSQHGEDGVIAEILHRIGVTEGWFVEFGIESGHEGNCVFLADVLGWSGLFIEADETDHAALARKYAANPRVTTPRAAVTPANAEALFGRAGVPPEPDILSIDVDGDDYWIWESIQGYRPRAVVIEYNPTLPPGRRLVQPADHPGGWAATDFFGASLDALADLGERKGYRLVHTDLAAANAFFVRTDVAEGRFVLAAEVPRRSEPNYFMLSHHHPADTSGRRYVDLDGHRSTAEPYTATALPRHTPSVQDAERLIADSTFLWHQRFELAAGVFTPGTNDVGFLCATAGIPEQLNGESVLDIGTTNGGVAFELERRGAGRVMAVDILDADTFGFNTIRDLLGSRATHLQASIYELPELLGEQFDIVLFLGVLYHLRHPLLALDNVRRLTRRWAYIESAICDGELPQVAGESVARFYRQRELGDDPTNWFAPTLAALGDWCRSCGLEPVQIRSWPEGAPSRGMVSARPSDGPPEWQQISYDQPLVARIDRG
jgi:SAM-dependent methyltransferase